LPSSWDFEASVVHPAPSEGIGGKSHALGLYVSPIWALFRRDETFASRNPEGKM